MKTLLICGMDGRMGGETARLAPDYGFIPQPFRPGTPGDIIIDFSHPDCLSQLLASPLPLVTGTTGLSDAQQHALREAARRRPVFQAANFSPGIFAMQRALLLTRHLLPGWTPVCIERHHSRKRDVPSGTALALRGLMPEPEMPILSVRAGTVCGMHEVSLYGPDETLTLCHTAERRAVFARGALSAALWLSGKPAGLYGMADMLPGDNGANFSS